MKIIFLDIDGVLNYQASEAVYRGGIGISRDNVEVLRYIVEQTGAEIVLTSTWKKWWEKSNNKHPSGAYIDKMLGESGIKVYDKTPGSVVERGQGIDEYLKTHKVDSWIVIDDEIFPDFEQFGILPRLVKPSFYRAGLTMLHAEQAVELLNNATSLKK